MSSVGLATIGDENDQKHLHSGTDAGRQTAYILRANPERQSSQYLRWWGGLIQSRNYNNTRGEKEIRDTSTLHSNFIPTAATTTVTALRRGHSHALWRAKRSHTVQHEAFDTGEHIRYQALILKG